MSSKLLVLYQLLYLIIKIKLILILCAQEIIDIMSLNLNI